MAHIAIDIRALQTPTSRERGIGYAIRGWLAAFLAMPYDHRVTLIVDPRLDPPAMDMPLSGPYWQTAPFESHPEINRLPDIGSEIQARERTEEFLAALKADLVHFTSPFETAISIGDMPRYTPCVATFYDALPALYPDDYLGAGLAFARAYYAKLASLRRCARIIAISHASAADLSQLVGAPRECVDVAHLAATAEMFAPVLPSAVQAVRSRIGKPYFFALLGDNPTKNVENLIAAYCLLPAAIRATHKLVITYRIADWHRPQVQRWLEAYQTGDDVLFTDWVSREELKALFAGATAYVHPALREGFGLPVIEAMAQGRPVIAANTGSIPEVVGNCALRVDPYRPADIARAMARVVLEPRLAHQMGQRGFARALEFDWTLTARQTRQTYERALAAGQPMSARCSDPGRDIQLDNLSRLADVSDRHYRVTSRAPLIGPVIARARRELTAHLREAYFDPAIERQVRFNRLAVDTLHQWVINMAIQPIDATRAQMKAGTDSSHASADLIAEAARLAPCSMPNIPRINEVLAGPLPEYGDLFGRAFYHRMREACLAIPAQHSRAHDAAMALWEVLRQAERMEEEMRQISTLSFWDAVKAPLTSPGRLDLEEKALIKEPYRIRSGKRIAGRLLEWIRGHVTSHLDKPYIEPFLQRQQSFNLAAARSLTKSLDQASARQLGRLADTGNPDYRIRSHVAIAGPWIVRIRRQLTSHLREPYVDPIIARQQRFNQALVGAIRDCLALKARRPVDAAIRLEREMETAIQIAAQQWTERLSQLVEMVSTEYDHDQEWSQFLEKARLALHTVQRLARS